MDAKGYVKLVDLGLAKQITTGSTWYAKHKHMHYVLSSVT